MIRHRHSPGFTLIELLLVIVIIGILAGIVVVRTSGSRVRAQVSTAQAELATLRSALHRFEMDVGRYPDPAQGLQDLINAGDPPPKGWEGPYFDPPRRKLDPWGNPYVYRLPGSINPRGFDLLSKGPDGQEGTEDDIPAPEELQAGDRR